MRSSGIVCGMCILILAPAIANDASAAVMTFNSQPSWLAAIGGLTNQTVFHFDNPSEAAGLSANDPAIQPSYSSRGVDFLPFTGTNVYPVILRGQGFQIPDPARDGLLGNSVSPNPTTDLIGRAIRFEFNISTNAVGVFTNSFLDGDGGYLEALDTSLAPMGRVDLQPGVFGGLVTERPISHVVVVNTFNSDIK